MQLTGEKSFGTTSIVPVFLPTVRNSFLRDRGRAVRIFRPASIIF